MQYKETLLVYFNLKKSNLDLIKLKLNKKFAYL